MTRSSAKKEAELVKALKKDMKGKKINPATGKVVKPKRKPPAPKPPKPPKDKESSPKK